jgi:hypothetical protein
MTVNYDELALRAQEAIAELAELENPSMTPNVEELLVGAVKKLLTGGRIEQARSVWRDAGEIRVAFARTLMPVRTAHIRALCAKSDAKAAAPLMRELLCDAPRGTEMRKLCIEVVDHCIASELPELAETVLLASPEVWAIKQKRQELLFEQRVMRAATLGRDAIDAMIAKAAKGVPLADAGPRVSKAVVRTYTKLVKKRVYGDAALFLHSCNSQDTQAGLALREAALLLGLAARKRKDYVRAFHILHPVVEIWPGWAKGQSLAAELTPILVHLESWEGAVRLIGRADDSWSYLEALQCRLGLGMVRAGHGEGMIMLERAVSGLQMLSTSPAKAMRQQAVGALQEDAPVRRASDRQRLQTLQRRFKAYGSEAVETLLLQGRIADCVHIRAMLLPAVDGFQEEYRKVAVQEVTRLMGQDTLGPAIPGMRSLLEIEPLWTTSQRIALRLARAFLGEDRPQDAVALAAGLEDARHIADLIAVDVAIWSGRTDNADWRKALSTALRDLDVDWFVTAEGKVKKTPEMKELLDEAQDRLYIFGKKLIADDRFEDAFWVMEQAEMNLPTFGQRFRKWLNFESKNWIEAHDLKRAAQLAKPLMAAYPHSNTAQVCVENIAEAFLDEGDSATALDLLEAHPRVWSVEDGYLVKKPEEETFPLRNIVAFSQEVGEGLWHQSRWADYVAQWWDEYEAQGGLNLPRDFMPARDFMLEIAQYLIDEGAFHAAQVVLRASLSRITGDSKAFILLAHIATAKGDLRLAVERWQMAAALGRPANKIQGKYMLQPADEDPGLAAELTGGLRMARCALAIELANAGEMREFSELACRITETLGSTSVYQENPLILEVISTYLRLSLEETHAVPAQMEKEAAPQRLVIVLDVLKLSDLHLHSRVVFTIARSLLDRFDGLDIEVVITNERFAVTRPNIASWIDFEGNEYTLGFARTTVGENYFGNRFKLHFERSFGLEGVVRTCKKIIDLAPDVVAYAGGHGRYSNDSRLVRHALQPYCPSALFFLGVDNVLDDKVDMIIPRGPHALVGDPGEAAIRIQTYPTLPGSEEKVKTPEERPAQRFAVSALAGARLDTRLTEIGDDDLRMLLSIFERNPDVVWHLVGADQPERIIAAVDLLRPYVETGRIVISPIMEIDAFRDFVTDASLFIQLPGFKGGAGGAGLARRGGVPILTFANSDVSGRQPPETIFDEDDIAGMADKAAAILLDADEARRIVQSQFDYADHIRETAVSGFYDCLCEARRMGAYRINKEPYPFGKTTIVDLGLESIDEQTSKASSDN